MGRKRRRNKNLADKAQALAGFQQTLAGLGGSVASGLLSGAQAAGVLAAQYGIAANQALLLVNAQARVAGGQARLAAQAAQTRDQSGSVGFDAPGRSRTTDADVFASINAAQREAAQEQQGHQAALVNLELAKARAAKNTTAEIQIQRSELAKLVPGSNAYLSKQAEIIALQARGAGGGAAGVKAQQDVAQKSIDLEQQTQDRRTQIAQEAAKRRAEAEQAFSLQQKGDRASFYESLASIDDNKVRQALSAKFEAANADAAQLAKTQGADVAASYLTAAQKAIESEQQIQKQIDEANKSGDKGKADFLTGVLKLRQEANAAELEAIKSKGSAINSAEAAQYAQSENQFSQHLDKLDQLAKKKGVTLGQVLPPGANPDTKQAGIAGTGTTQAAPATAPVGALPATTPGKAQPVEDVATPGAIDTQTARLEGRLNSVIDALQAVKAEISTVKGAIDGLKGSGTFAPAG